VVYTLQFSSEKNDNKWKLAEAYSTFISFGNTSFALGKAHPRGNDVTFNRTSEVWGRCILNNTIYEYCTFAENEGLSLPPNNLFVATSKSSEDYSYNSAPILGQILNREIQTIKEFACMTGIGCLLFFIQSPDIISTYPVYATSEWSKEAVRGDKAQDKRQYYNMKAVTWHELIHTSQYERFKNERGFDAAKSYFIEYGKMLVMNYLSGKNEGNVVYGKKGEKNWQSIAMSEGWAKYNEWLLAKKHIQYNSLYQVMWNYDKRTPMAKYLEKYKEKDFPFNYSVMFYELHNAGCSIKDMEISLSTNTLAGLRDNLIAKNPSDKKEIITQLIAKYE
jgi:hypothetical protein